jgi:hypothetical protein
VGWNTNDRMVRGFASSAVQKIDEEGNYALRGVIFRYLTPDNRQDPTDPRTSLASLSTPVASALWVGMVFVGGLWLLAVLWRERSGPAGRLLEFSLVLTAILLASPHTQRQHLSALCVPVLALLALLSKYPAMPLRLPVMIALAVTAAASTLLPLLLSDRRLAVLYEAGSPYFFATLVLFVTLIPLTRRLKAEQL